MKRLFLMAFMAVFATVAFASNPIKVVSGDKKFFKSAEGNVFLEVIYDNASFDDKMPLTEKYSDIEAKTLISYNGFIEEFANKKSRFNFIKDEVEATYKITINVTKVDEFVNIMGFIPGPCIRVWGTLTVTDVKTGDSLLVVDIDEIDGGSAPTTDRAFNDTFGELGKRMAKLK
ncbi:MAG: hypothetical protein K6G25_05255 [Bacteroidales bacterium]|nr:hypothetical protein [Bacteroidales bacterium]